MFRLTLAVTLLAPLATVAATQSESIVVGQGNRLYELTPTGTIVSTLLTLPRNQSVFSVEVVPSEDNRSLRVVMGGSILDVTGGGVANTIHTFPNGFQYRGMTLNGDGDWLVQSRGPSSFPQPQYIEFHILRGNAMTMISQAPVLGFVSVFRAHGFNEANGHAIMCQLLTNGRCLAYYEVDVRAGAIVTLSQAASSLGGVHPRYDRVRGGLVGVDVFTPLLQPQFPSTHLVNIGPGNSITKLSRPAVNELPVGFVEASGRAYPVHYRVFTKTVPTRNGTNIHALDESGGIITGTTFTGVEPQRVFFRARSRHLAWSIATPPNDRRLNLDFPGEGDRPYAAIFGLSGVLPGQTLPGGRTVPIVFDGLGALSLAGGVAPILRDTLGTLDAAGRATVRINANPLGAAVSGLPVWAVALVFDPASPSGIAHIAGPERRRKHRVLSDTARDLRVVSGKGSCWCKGADDVGYDSI